MVATQLDERLSRIEANVERIEANIAQLKQERAAPTKKPWWEEIRGTFKDAPAYVEAMQLGREWQESQAMETAPPCRAVPARSRSGL